VAPRTRILAFGSAALLVVVGVICAVFAGGLAGEVVAIALVSAGLGGVVLLVFLEVGMSEDRERAREEKRGPRPR
jgi:membrane associated rhomboid family serine protease